jgi:capsid portal protein
MPDEQIVHLDPELVSLHKETIQPSGDEIQWHTPDGCLEPPESLDAIAAMTRASSIRGSCLDALALNTVGLGYTIAPDHHTAAQGDADAAETTAERITQALEDVAHKDRKLERPSFTSLMLAVKRDEEEFGTGYLEVSRDRRTGMIDGLYHAPPRRIRRLADRTGYAMLAADSSVAVRFLNYGEKVLYDNAGKPTNTLATGASWARNELLAFRVYNSESRDYGLPRDVALSLDYLGDKKAAEANVTFFDSSGTPPTVLFVQGVESRDGGRITFKVPAETSKRIAETLRSDAGHRHRVAVIPVPPGTSTKEVQLGQISERDMGFTDFRADNESRTLKAFRLQPIFVGSAGDGRYDAEVQRSITLEQVFDPEQRRYEDRIAQSLLRDLGYPGWRISFKRLAVEADAARRESAERMAEVSAITNGEFREAHGYAPLPEDGTIIPTGWSKTLVAPPKLPAGAPEGAQNRVNAASDQRGLRPGIGGRTSRDKATGQDRHVEAGVANLREAVGATSRTAVDRAVARGRAA